MPELAPTESIALARILDDLDYYQLLHLPREATPSQVRAAYHSCSRAFHPDAHRHLEGELPAAVGSVAKRITEAYSVLRNPRRRRAYDERLRSGAGTRIQLAEADAAGGRGETEQREGRTPQGRQFYNLAAADLRRGDLAGAVRNLQTALTFEPDNAGFKAELAAARDEMERLRKQSL